MSSETDTDDERIARRLRDLAQFGRDAQYTVSLGREAFVADTPDGRILRNSARHILIQVGTVVEKLPQRFKDEHPGVDWVGISRMRNLIAHHYDKGDDQLIFQTLTGRIPELLDQLGVED